MPRPAVSATTTTRTSAPARRFLAVLVALLVGLLTVTAGAGAPEAAAGPRHHDRLSISGYDFESELAADVVAGSSGNHLVLRFSAGRALTDGTLVLTLPRPAWRSPLHVGDGLWEGEPRTYGSVVVRPVEEFGQGVGPQDCRGTSGSPTVTVRSTARAQVATVSHLSCRAGQSLTVRVFGVEAPERPGRYSLPVSVSDARGHRAHANLRLRVVPRPTTRLSVDVPSTLQTNTRALALVRALRPDGRPDRSYRGTVRLRAVDRDDCTLQADLVTFTRADAGVVAVPFSVQTDMSHRLVVDDVTNRAREGRSGPYTVLGPLEPVVCPVAYH